MLKRLVNKAVLIGCVGAFISAPIAANSSWDGERLALEMSIQKRVEDALVKIIPADQFVLVVRVEPWTQPMESSAGAEADSGFSLPGVPERQKFDGGNDVKKLVESLKPESPMFRRFIRRLTVTLVLDQSLSEETVSRVRDLTSEMIGIDVGRGDTLEIQRTAFQRPVPAVVVDTNFSRLQKSLQNYWLLISLALIMFCVTIFFLFIFGPFRGFLNRFVQVLPTLKSGDQGSRYSRMNQDMPYPPQMMGQQPYGYLPPLLAGAAAPASFSGSLQVENPNKTIVPFGFIREDHLGNLAILLSRETPERAAIVLGYLPPDWISRILTRIDPQLQSDITTHLATTKQLLPEQVEDIEQDLKRRLDYLIGGPDRIFAIYESLDPEAQKRMMDSLKLVRPEVADELRQKSLIFEDLEKLDVQALKAVLREVDLQTLVVSLPGVSEFLKNRILENVSQGKADIIKEELELNALLPGKATSDAQKKVMMVARRLEKEGHIQIPQVSGAIANQRVSLSPKSTLRFPPDAKVEDAIITGENKEGSPKSKDGIEERIRRFMSRREPDRERFGSENETSPDLKDKER